MITNFFLLLLIMDFVGVFCMVLGRCCNLSLSLSLDDKPFLIPKIFSVINAQKMQNNNTIFICKKKNIVVKYVKHDKVKTQFYNIYIYIYIYIYNHHAGSTDIPDPLSPLFLIIHRLRQVFWTTTCILTVAECMFVLVVLLLHGHVWGSIRVHHLWVRPCFSSSVLHVWFA